METEIFGKLETQRRIFSGKVKIYLTNHKHFNLKLEHTFFIIIN